MRKFGDILQLNLKMGTEHNKGSEWEKSVDKTELEALTRDVDLMLFREFGPNKLGYRYIQNDEKDRRWRVSRNVHNDGRDIAVLELSGQTSGGTWHELMELFLIKDSETKKLLNLGVSLSVIAGDWGDTTPSTNMFYSMRTGENLSKGPSGGYYGERERIEQDVKKMGALALTESDLPQKINVIITAQTLLTNFKQGKYGPPPFVLP